jgi:hypothetical protein
MTPIAPHITAFLRKRLAVDQRASPHTCDTYAYAFQLRAGDPHRGCLPQDVGHLSPVARGMAMYITRASPLYAQPHTCEIDVLPMDVDEAGLRSMPGARDVPMASETRKSTQQSTHIVSSRRRPSGRVHVSATGTYANRRSQ